MNMPADDTKQAEDLNRKVGRRWGPLLSFTRLSCGFIIVTGNKLRCAGVWQRTLGYQNSTGSFSYTWPGNAEPGSCWLLTAVIC